MNELPIIQKTYDLIKWYVPILNKLPRDHKFNLGDRMIANLYDLLESLVIARYTNDKLGILEQVNAKLELLRYQTRLLYLLDGKARAVPARVSVEIKGAANESGQSR